MSTNQNKIKVGVLGASGYTGGELIRLLINHPNCKLISLCSKSNHGKKVSDVHNDLLGDCEIKFKNKLEKDIDVIFFCLGHGNSYDFIRNNKLGSKVKIIDLSQDFRLDQTIDNRKFIYGLPEFQKEKIKNSFSVANPGCFATAIQLGILPILSRGIKITEIHTNAITGSTGAGFNFCQTSHFSWRDSNLSWYKPFKHQHLNEIYSTIKKISNNKTVINFLPIRGNFTRGIFCTSYFYVDKELKQFYKIYNDYYENDPFTIVSENKIFLKQVINTNKCIIHLEKIKNKLLVTTIIDNLCKGASGQAIQNMNLMFGIDEKTGLNLKSSIF